MVTSPGRVCLPPNHQEIFSMLRGPMYLGADEVVTYIAKVLEVDKLRFVTDLP